MKKKRFRRVKVGRMGYVSWKRLQGFRAVERKQKGPSGTEQTGGGKEGSRDDVL